MGQSAPDKALQT